MISTAAHAIRAVAVKLAGCDGYAALILLILAMSASCHSRGVDVSDRELWRFAIEESEGSVQHEYALKFKELIETKSDGRIEVIVYPYGTLGTSTQMTEQLNMGIIEFAMASPGSAGKFIPELQVFLLHFLFSEDDGINKGILSQPGVLATFDALYAEKGLKLLSIFPEGQMVWTTKREIRQPSDFRGVKMRVMTSPILLAAYDAYGASSTAMPYAEVYSALQLNMIDGQVNPVFAIERQKFHEVTNWLIFPKHAHFITTAAANRSFFQSLSQSQREFVLETVAELSDYIFDVQRRMESERLKTIIYDKKRKRSPLHVSAQLDVMTAAWSASEKQELIDDNPYLHVTAPLSEEERAAFQERSLEVREEFLRIGGARGKEVLDMILHAVAEAEGSA